MKERIRQLAKAKNLSLTKLEEELGFGNGTITKWDKASPNLDKLKKVADYFNVSIDYLIGRENTQQKNALPPLTVKDEKMLAKELERIMNDVSQDDFAAMGGTVEDENDRELLRSALETTLRLSRQLAKKRFTPKKYRHWEKE